MEELLRDLIERFNKRVEGDSRLRSELEGLERTIQISTGKSSFYLNLKDCRIDGPEEGETQGAEVTIHADEDTLKGVLTGEIPPFKAMALRKLKIKASMEDAIRLRKLLS